MTTLTGLLALLQEAPVVTQAAPLVARDPWVMDAGREAGTGVWLAATIVKMLLFFTVYMVTVAYLTLAERKISAWIQDRYGPNRVGPSGLFQPLADGLKNLMKEETFPAHVNRPLFILGPVLAFIPALITWAVLPFGAPWDSPWGRIEMALAPLPVGFLYILAITSLGVYGIVIAGWSSNNKYSLLGGLRSSAQMVSYEIAIGFCMVVVLMVSGSLNLTDIVQGQQAGRFQELGLNFLSWNWLPLLPIFVVYVVSAVAETNRHPFDVVEGESEIVAGHMVEYSGMGFAIFFLAEYANMILLSALASIMFLGGWDAPVAFLSFVPGWIWLGLKTFFVVSCFVWFRASFPRYRYDQIMRLGWKVFIPLTLVWLIVVGAWMQTPYNIWK